MDRMLAFFRSYWALVLGVLVGVPVAIYRLDTLGAANEFPSDEAAYNFVKAVNGFFIWPALVGMLCVLLLARQNVNASYAAVYKLGAGCMLSMAFLLGGTAMLVDVTIPSGTNGYHFADPAFAKYEENMQELQADPPDSIPR